MINSLSVPSTGTRKYKHRQSTVGGSVVHIRQQHMIDHLQNVHRDALAVLQGGFDTGDILRAGCIVVVRLPAAWAAWVALHVLTSLPTHS